MTAALLLLLESWPQLTATSARVVCVPADTRTVAVDAVSLTTVVPADDRTLVVPEEATC